MRITTEDLEKDRISSLPDKLIHRILSFLDTPFAAVRTSVLSKRWKLIWTTLPFLHFEIDAYNECFFAKLDNLFSRRNHDSDIVRLMLHTTNVLDLKSMTKYVKYSISHNAQDLSVHTCHRCDFSIFSSVFLTKLKLVMDFEHDQMQVLDCWRLPFLTSLHLVQYDYIHMGRWEVPISCLICLPALTNLRLDGFCLPSPFSLPALTNLHLVDCKLPQTIWNLPALRTLKLDRVVHCENMEFFTALVNLQNLTLVSCFIKDFKISCPQLLYLKLKTRLSGACSRIPNIVIFAPKLHNINTAGIFSITHGASNLENVNIELSGCFRDKTKIPWETLKQCYTRFTCMFAGLGSAKILTLDLYAIEALSAVSDLLQCSSSPFHNLKYVRLPRGYKESSLSGTIKSYLLGGSPGATIVTVTELPQNDKILQIMPVSITSQNVGLWKPLANPTMELVDSQEDTLDLETRVQEDHLVENSVVVDGKIGHVSGLMPNTQRSGTDCASSARGKKEFGLWQGYEVNSEFVGLLDLIMKRYPETFEHFTTRSKKFCTMKLNMLCTSVNAFTTTTMTEIDTEMITEYRTLFDDLQRSFNIEWLVSRLNYIEQLHFSQNELHAIESSIDDAKSKLVVLQNLRTEKMTKMKEAFGTMGTNLVRSAGYIGDDLFSGP